MSTQREQEIDAANRTGGRDPWACQRTQYRKPAKLYATGLEGWLAELEKYPNDPVALDMVRGLTGINRT